MSGPFEILMIEDSDSDVELVLRTLSKGGIEYSHRRVETAEALKAALEEKSWDLVLSDNNLPNFNAIEALTIVQDMKKDIPFIVVSGAIGEEKAVDLLLAGAKDFISKTNLSRLAPAVVREIEDCGKRARLNQVEAKLDESERTFSMMIENARDYAIFLLDPNGRVTTWNSGARRLLGYSESEAIGQNADLFYTEEDRKAGVFSRDLKKAKSETRVEEERWQVRKNGGRFWASGTLTAILNPDGSLHGYTRIMRDHTEKKVAMEQIEEARKRAEMANKAKTQFLANMSHEIRTPLGIMLGFSELMADPQHSDEERKNFADTILRNGQQLSRIINDVLDVSKVETNKLETEKGDFSLSEFLADLLAMTRFQAEEKGLELVVTSEGPVPRRIYTDANRLRQILVNLIGNAIKFTEMGVIELRVRSVSSPQTHSSMILQFEVKDTGRGISPDDVSKLFHPFVQGDSSTARKFGGTGLGLYLSKRLSQALGGDLNLRETGENRGSTFVFTIDAGPFETDVTFYTERASGNQSDQNLYGTKVLIVDDSPDNRLLVQRILQHANAEVGTAENGSIAVDMAMSGDYDIVLMDIHMPVMDGYQAFHELRDRGFQKPIVALTAHALHSEREHCFSLGFDDHLSKPIDRKGLLESIQRLTLRHGSSHRPHLVSIHTH